MKKYICLNCGQDLTEESIALAKEEAGVVNGDELAYCCPRYTDEEGCLGYCQSDDHLAAYWEVR